MNTSLLTKTVQPAESTHVVPQRPLNSGTAPDFNRLARIYRWLEYFTFGPILWRCRTHFLARLSHCRRALILGDGDGRFTARLLHANPQIRIHAIDGSPRMIESLEQGAALHRSRLTTEVADLRDWNPAQTEQYDLLVTHFFLDCLTTSEVAELAFRLTPATTSNALWLISEFAIPDTRFGRMIAAPLIALLYRVFRLLTGLSTQALPDHSRALAQSGWRLERQQLHLFGLLTSQLWRRSGWLTESCPAPDSSI